MAKPIQYCKVKNNSNNKKIKKKEKYLLSTYYILASVLDTGEINGE